MTILIDFIGDRYGKLTCLLLAGIVCIIPMLQIYQSYPKLCVDQKITKKLILQYLLWILAIVLLGILMNIILTNSPLVKISSAFTHSSQILTDGNIVIKIICNCLVIPILEELLLRGIIAGQLYIWYGPIPAVIISAIFFGILHNNIVQFIYAVVVGLGLGLMFVKSKRLSLCIIAHCMINLMVIIFS